MARADSTLVRLPQKRPVQESTGVFFACSIRFAYFWNLACIRDPSSAAAPGPAASKLTISSQDPLQHTQHALEPRRFPC